MAIRSLLFSTRGVPPGLEATPEPEYFSDLNLDQVVAAIDRSRPGHRVTPYFRHRLLDVELIRFRQAVFADLESPGIRAAAERFSSSMHALRRRQELTWRVRHPLAAQRWFLDAVVAKAGVLTTFARDLSAVAPDSAGLRAVREDLSAHVSDPAFRQAVDDAVQLRDRLGEIRYELTILGDRVAVDRHHAEAATDFSQQVAARFERFRQAPPDTTETARGDLGLDHVEAEILDHVAALHPAVFADLAALCSRHGSLIADDVARLDRELQFYLGYLEFLTPLREAGLATSLPEVAGERTDVRARDGFDVALAAALIARGRPVIVNDVSVTGDERILVVTGPNQGGKSTFARAFGQLQHLAGLGCPVPGRETRTFAPDRLFTHFARAEMLEDVRGNLEAELQRAVTNLEHATANSIVIVNEVFAGTTLADARSLSEYLLEQLTDLDAIGICVTFIDELSRLNHKTVSMVSTVDQDDATVRTFQVVRKVADGRAHARALAQRHGLTYEQLTGRDIR